MDRYASKDYKQPVNSAFVTRYAKLCADKQAVQEIQKEEDFKEGYRKGTLRYAVASKHLNLLNAGLDTFVEADKNIVWRREGDVIIRVDNDLDWVDSYLKEENS